MIETLYGNHFNISYAFVDCRDQGHTGSSKFRIIIVLQHKKKSRQIYNWLDLYHDVTKQITKYCSTQPMDYLVSSDIEIMRDAEILASTRHKTLRWQNGKPNLFSLLTSRERLAISNVKKMYKKRYKEPAENNPNLFLYLSDSQTKRITWSGSSNRIPTFRTNSGKMWHVKSRQASS
jgi:hypothetical protein